MLARLSVIRKLLMVSGSAAAPNDHVHRRNKRLGLTRASQPRTDAKTGLGDFASYLSFLKTTHLSDRPVFEFTRLTLERLDLKIADGLPKLCDDRSVRSSLEAYGFNVRTDQGLLEVQYSRMASRP